MRPSIESSRSSVDHALLSLILDGIDRYGIDTLHISQIEDSHVDELFELTMDILGESRRETMRMLPKEKKLLLIKQIAVFIQ
jgi:hypothetical protein